MFILSRSGANLMNNAMYDPLGLYDKHKTCDRAETGCLMDVQYLFPVTLTNKCILVCLHPDFLWLNVPKPTSLFAQLSCLYKPRKHPATALPSSLNRDKKNWIIIVSCLYLAHCFLKGVLRAALCWVPGFFYMVYRFFINYVFWEILKYPLSQQSNFKPWTS